MASGKLCRRVVRLLHATESTWARSAHLHSRPAPCLGVKDQNVVKAYAGHRILREHNQALTSKRAYHPASTLTGKDAKLAANYARTCPPYRYTSWPIAVIVAPVLAERFTLRYMLMVKDASLATGLLSGPSAVMRPWQEGEAPYHVSEQILTQAPSQPLPDSRRIGHHLQKQGCSRSSSRPQ